MLADPDVHMHTYAAAIGLGVIGLTGVVEASWCTSGG